MEKSKIFLLTDCFKIYNIDLVKVNTDRMRGMSELPEKQIKRLTKQMEETTDEEYRKKLASRVVELNMQKLI